MIGLRYTIKGINCPHCAATIEESLRKTPGLEDAALSFAAESISFPEDRFDEVRRIVASIEPEAEIVSPHEVGTVGSEHSHRPACRRDHDYYSERVHGDAHGHKQSHERDEGDAHDHGHSREHDRSHARDHEHNDEHDHAHSHDHGTELQIPLIVISSVLLLIGVVFSHRLHATPSSWAEYAVLIPAYLLVGWPVIKSAFVNLWRGQILDENALMTIASLGALAIGELQEAAAVMVFYSVGEFFQHRSVDKSRRSVSALLDIRPEYANLKENGKTRLVRPEDVHPGDLIIIKPGERVPLDGEVTDGDSFVDTSALTGEAVPRQISAGHTILAGMVNSHGLLTVRVTKPFGQSAVSRILELVQSAASRKAHTEQFITRFSRYYTPCVVILALAGAVLPPVFIPGQMFSDWAYRSLVMLAISCPCALVISVPLGYFGGIGGAARKGILVKGANYLDALAEAHTVVYDKTGTLTKGVFKVTQIAPEEGFSPEEVLGYAAAAEAYSSHPIAQSIRQAYGKDIPDTEIEQYCDVAGHGVSATIRGRRVLAGRDTLLARANIDYQVVDSQGTVVYVAVDGVFAGFITISDELREDSKDAVRRLRSLGVGKIVMLTGDQEAAAEKIAKDLDLDGFYPELLPEDKVDKIEKMKSVLPNPERNKLVFVGDGINDAPVIARADIGVAMGGLGSDAAIEAADVVLMEDAPSKLATAISVSRWTRRIVRQNVALALGVKGFFIVLGGFGVATIWQAVFADVGVALLAVFNSMRTLRYSGE